MSTVRAGLWSPVVTSAPCTKRRFGQCQCLTLTPQVAILGHSSLRLHRDRVQDGFPALGVTGARVSGLFSVLTHRRKKSGFVADKGLQPHHMCSASAETQGAVEVAEDGDLVAVHYRLRTEDGALLDSSVGREPLTFEIGAGDVVGNPLYQSFDTAARGLAVGEVQIVKSRAGEWNEEMLFEVSRDHEEVQRLEKVAAESDDGPLQRGSIVELVNGEPAVIVAIDDNVVKIDANHPLAGTMLDFEVEVVAIQKRAR